MAKTIDVTEHGSNRRLTIIVSNILHFESLTYNSGPTVTRIVLTGEKEIHVDELLHYVKKMIGEAED